MYLVPFSRISKSNIPMAGGKGANLGEMTAANFPVPSGFVLTTAGYKAFIEAHRLQDQIIELANTVALSDPLSAENASSQIKQLFMTADIPANIAQVVQDAFMQLGAETVAVRSSATAEDLPDASFAGQQDTFLNIRDKAALLTAVKECWASLWTARAIVYRQRQGIDPADVSLAVVVQALVDADSSGILFTADPTTGERDHILINATWGLGEAIVSGLVTPDSLIIDKSSWQIESRETATKTTMTVRTESGTKEQAVPADLQSSAVLDDDMAVSLAQIGAKIAEHYSMPMDIEWAITDGSISILQARPITSLPPAPLKAVKWEPVVPNTVWMRRQIVEHMPEPLTPLFEDLYLKRGMNITMNDLLGAMSDVAGARIDYEQMMPHGFAGTINGYAYTTSTAKMSGSIIWAVLKIYTRLGRFLRAPAFDWEGHVLPEYQRITAKWAAVDLAEAKDEKLLQGLAELATADSSFWFGSAPNLGLSRALDTAFDRFLKSFLIRNALPEPRPVSASFLRGFDSKALDAQADMEATAARIRASESLQELLHNTPADQLMTALRSFPEGQEITADIEQYFANYGHQIYNLDFATPTQNEDPLPMLLSLKALVSKAPEVDARTRQANMAAERESLVEQTVKSLNPVSRRLFNWAWKWTKYYAPYRESVMFYLGYAWPTARMLAHELGQRWVAAGILSSPDDIYYLNSDEIRQQIANPESSSLAALAQERRQLRLARLRLTPEPKVPVGSSLKFGPIDLSIFEPTPAGADNDGPVMKGHAVSTGSVTARASVIRSVEEFGQMKPGTILVCTTTTPAWTPLFSQAVGLVTDIGGALAHGSIVAREYGIPAVMGLGVATERIQSGMMLTVDGNTGTVTIVDMEEAAPKL